MIQSPDWRGSVIGAMLGACGFFAVFGYTPLIGSNIGWLFGGDPMTYYLSAAFFQQSPWIFPPGLNPHYGLEIPSAIGLADAIPLMGFIFKALYGFTGATVQYLGLWLLVCFTLQGTFGWLLAGQFTQSRVIKLSTTLLVLFMPAFLARSIQFNHFPLSGHFLILAGLVIYFRPITQSRWLMWVGLTSVAVLCNTYIFAMVFGIWIADVCARAFRSEQNWFILVKEAFLVIVTVLVMLWLSGLFALDSDGYAANGFGLYRANLLSILDSTPSRTRWSYFLPPTPKVSPNNNAPNFLGSGLLLLLFVTMLVSILKRVLPPWRSRTWFLIAASMLMALFSLSNRISIGSFEFVIPISDNMQNTASILRDSGRFMWPISYLLVVGVVNLLSNHVNRRTAVCIFFAAAAIQVVDTRSGWAGVSESIASRRQESWPTTLKSPFWDRAGRAYMNVRQMPSGNYRPRYAEIAYFALIHHMRTNAVYLSRSSQLPMDRENEQFDQDLRLGQVDSRTLYILNEQYFQTALKAKKPGDLLERIDGFLVFAPGWLTVSGCSNGGKPSPARGCIATRTLGDDVLGVLDWRGWGKGIINTKLLEISSDSLTDGAIVSSPIKLIHGTYQLTACMSWDVEGPRSGAAHVSIHGKKKLIEIQSSKAEEKCLLGWIDVPSGAEEFEISIGLGGWSVGKGRIRLESIKIQPLVES